ncbi:MAG: hypothetical protein ACC618_00675 [Patescibacteria group bacterium]
MNSLGKVARNLTMTLPYNMILGKFRSRSFLFMIMMKKALATLVLTAALFLVPGGVYAKTVCTQAYGQPVKCYEEEEVVLGVHEPVDADLADDLGVLSIGLLVASGVFIYLSKRTRKPSFNK